MKDAECVAFLQWCLPQLGMRWRGFRKVRGQVCKRIVRRMAALELANLDDYRALLGRMPDEWDRLGEMCRVTISRFYRDHGVFERLVRDVFPVLGRPVRCWCAGCASGEEPYTIAISLRHSADTRELGNRGATRSDRDDLRILATDIDERVLERARLACYPPGTLKELPDALIEAAFHRTDDSEEPYCLNDTYRSGIVFRRHDVREAPPEGPFDLILCRNLVFTYLDEEEQRSCLQRFATVLRSGGAFVIGKHESMPESERFEPWFPSEGIFRRIPGAQ